MLRVVLVAAVLSGCGITQTRQVVDFRGACTKSSDLRFIIDGQQIPDTEQPASVMIRMPGSLCSGTFVSGNTILTAAHCLTDDNNGEIRAGDVRYKNTTASKLFRHSKYEDGSGQTRDSGGLDIYDVGVLVFASEIAPAHVDLAPAEPAVGTKVLMVGYGDTDRSNAGVKFKGENAIAGIQQNGMLRVQRADGVTAGSGDSGGTVLANGKLVANMVGGNDNVTLMSSFLNPGVTAFLKETVAAGAKICGFAGLDCNAQPTPTPTPSPTPTPAPTPTVPNPKPSLPTTPTTPIPPTPPGSTPTAPSDPVIPPC